MNEYQHSSSKGGGSKGGGRSKGGGNSTGNVTQQAGISTNLVSISSSQRCRCNSVSPSVLGQFSCQSLGWPWNISNSLLNHAPKMHGSSQQQINLDISCKALVDASRELIPLTMPNYCQTINQPILGLFGSRKKNTFAHGR
jgi:hypothetical protein